MEGKKSILERALERTYISARVRQTNGANVLLEHWHINDYEEALEFILGKKNIAGDTLIINRSEQKMLMTAMLYEKLLDEGRFLKSGNDIYYFRQHRLMHVEGREFDKYISNPFVRSIVGKDYILTFILHFAEDYEEIDIYKDFYYDKRKNKIYISDRIAGYWEITQYSLERKMNGSDGIYFLYREGSERDFEFVNPNLSEPERPLAFFLGFNYDELFLRKKEYAELLYAYTLTVVFESIIQSKPLLVLVGEKGSGKSTLSREMLRFLISAKENVIRLGKDEEELDIILTNQHFAVLDNLERKVKWLEDTLAIASTSGTKKKRRLYTTNDICSYEYRCFILINGINPSLRRPDVVDRILLISLKRLSKFKPDSEVGLCTDPLMLKKYYGGFFLDLQKMLQIINSGRHIDVNTRLAGFFKIMSIALMVIGRSEEEIKNIINKLNTSLQDYAIAEDDVVLSIKAFFDKEAGIDTILKTGCSRKEIKDVSGRELLSVLKENGLPDYYTTQKLIARLRNLKSNLRKEGFEFITRIGAHNKRLYTIEKID